MVCCTYFSGNEYTTPVSDKELQSLLELVRQKTERDWRLHEMRYTVGHLWWKRDEVCYELYLGIPCFNSRECFEYQVVNFYRGPNESSLPGGWPTVAISAYFYGLLGECSQLARRNAQTEESP